MKKPSIASEEKVSVGQIETCVTLVADAARKAAGSVLRELTSEGLLTKRNIELVRSRGHEVSAAIREVVKHKFLEIAQNIVGLVCLISGDDVIEIAETDGTEVFVNAKDLFPACIYGTVAMMNVPGPATKKERVAVYELITDGKLQQAFCSMNEDLKKLCLEQSQIIEFVRNHAKWLRRDSCATFFLINSGNEFSVALVSSVEDSERGLAIQPFGDSTIWHAHGHHRFVVPEITCVNSPE